MDAPVTDTVIAFQPKDPKRPLPSELDRSARGNDTLGVGKQSNPKDRIGSNKLPLDLIPYTAQAHQALAHLDGAMKYGTWNWRIAGVRSSIYIAAVLRHVKRWEEGEECDAESGVHNLGHAIACLNILLDAQQVGKLVDDRPPSMPCVGAFQDDMNAEAKRIKERHADKAPYHFTIKDTL